MSHKVTLRVRMAARAPGTVPRRYRGGMLFGHEVRIVTVDAAAAARIKNDPLLQVDDVSDDTQDKEIPRATEIDSEPVSVKPATSVSPMSKKSKVNLCKGVHRGSLAGGDV